MYERLFAATIILSALIAVVGATATNNVLINGVPITGTAFSSLLLSVAYFKLPMEARIDFAVALLYVSLL